MQDQRFQPRGGNSKEKSNGNARRKNAITERMGSSLKLTQPRKELGNLEMGPQKILKLKRKEEKS